MSRFVFTTNFFTNTSIAEGNNTKANGLVSHTEGQGTQATGKASHAEGELTKADGKASHTEGSNCQAFGDYSHAEGYGSTTRDLASHAEGYGCTASGEGAHAEGESTTASELASHAEGFQTDASGQVSHAEGESTTASGLASHAEGFQTYACNYSSHAEGYLTTASGVNSHAEGEFTTASGNNSHAEGFNTSTNGYDGAHIMGQYGEATEPYSWFVANGNELAGGLGAKWLNSNGCMYIDGATYFTGGADYAEMFETVDGQPIGCGFFVSLNGKKIRKANSHDQYILGIVSSNPALVGETAEFRWKDKYVTDEWGRVQYQEVVVPAVTRSDKETVSEHTQFQPIYNPQWDNSREYISRLKRPEWVAVGLLGQILVRDDGTCQVDSYCMPNDDGIATASKSGYRVIERTLPNQIMVIFR